ncbi:MAG TPA: proprotein convertase P-domain-containing protein [Thermoanaerobaculia bacterium]|nr:proprotein convertase P-domain-containing protein [Thermoanaerobaculia bacterium]
MRPLLIAALTLAAVPATAELRLELVRESLTGMHCRYREYVDGIPSDEYVEDRQSCLSWKTQGQAGLPVLHLLRIRGRLAIREITHENSLPFAEDRDLETGTLIRRVPLFFNAKPARVFDPNPVAALNDTTLQDNNDAASAVPGSAYKLVELDNVADSGPLRGPHIALVDRQAPAIAPPDASASLFFNRNDDGFEDVNAYFHVDRTQRHLQSLGYTGSRAIAPYAVETDAHAGNLDNSLFLPSPTANGIGSLYFGTGGTDDAEDADLVVHEYGHALLEWIAPGTFSGTFNSQARAFSEGFCDYLAFSAHYAQRAASGRDPYCFADWDARCWTDAPSELCAYRPDSDCLRRLDSTRTMADYENSESAGAEHRNGTIWSSAMREIFHALGRDVTDTILIESTFGAPPLPSYAIMARRLIEADRLIYGGAHASAICAAMTSRGIVTAETCSIAPRGEWTHFQSVAGAIAIPDADPAGIVSTLTIGDTRTIENVFVRVDIAHPSRGDLRIELVAPDGTKVLLQQVSFERTRDVRVTFGVDANPVQPLSVLHGRGANGVWQLRVSDQRRRDLGTLLSWGLAFQFAGDAPLTERPRASDRQTIPVVARRHGAYDTFFASDLRITNPLSQRTIATLIFTPSGADGRTTFSAVNLTLEGGQTAGYDDVLASLFNTTGSGSLEILGRVVVMSRTYTRRGGGTVGQQVPPSTAATRRGGDGLIVGGFAEEGQRYNLGLTEVAGHEVVVRAGPYSAVVAPYSHVQFPVSSEPLLIEVVAGEGSVSAYLSQVDNTNRDAMFLEAESTGRICCVPGMAPAVDATGVSGARWRSDFWIAAAEPNGVEKLDFVDAVTGEATRTTMIVPTAVTGILEALVARTPAFGVLRTSLFTGTFHGTRIVSGNTSQFVPFVVGGNVADQHLVFIESSPAYRTNIGIVDDRPVYADVTVYDSAGRSIQHDVLLGDHGFAQVAVRVPVTNGHAVVRWRGNAGYAYASMIDNATGDATYIPGRQ